MSRTRHHGDNQKRRIFGDNWRWLRQTPGHWVSQMMTRPQRRAAKVWERRALLAADLDAIDRPPHGKRPHIYYW